MPPPPGITYITNGKSLELSWRPPILAQSVSGFAVLFKTSNTKTTYDLLLANLQSSFAKLNVSTGRDYEVFVAVLNAEDEMPGYFQRISCKLKYRSMLDFHGGAILKEKSLLETMLTGYLCYLINNY